MPPNAQWPKDNVVEEMRLVEERCGRSTFRDSSSRCNPKRPANALAGSLFCSREQPGKPRLSTRHWASLMAVTGGDSNRGEGFCEAAVENDLSARGLSWCVESMMLVTGTARDALAVADATTGGRRVLAGGGGEDSFGDGATDGAGNALPRAQSAAPAQRRPRHRGNTRRRGSEDGRCDLGGFGRMAEENPVGGEIDYRGKDSAGHEKGLTLPRNAHNRRGH